MPTFLPDTTCIVASIDTGHSHHAAAQAEIDRRIDRGETMVVAAHSLAEGYSVLTRLPEPYRLPPRVVADALQHDFVAGSAVVALDSSAYLSVLGSAPAASVLGGRIYDALIAACARLAGADTLLTFNARHFASFAGPDLRVVVPMEG